MRRATAVRVLGGGLCVCAATLAGCSSEPATEAAPSVSETAAVTTADPTPSSTPPGTSEASSASTTAAGSTTAPSPPQAARENSVGGAERFTSFWIERLNAAMKQADSSVLPALSLDTCRSCFAYNTIIGNMKANNEHFDGEWVTPTAVYSTEFQPGAAKVQVLAKQGGRIVSNTGAPVTTPAPTSGQLLFTLRYGDSWRVGEVQVVR